MAGKRTPPRDRSGAESPQWYRIENQADADTTLIYIYDAIGYWEVTASTFVQELSTVETPAIELHINSPGGDAFDAIAIYNALRNHDATVDVRIDGLAASAASFIAMAGDSILIERNAQMMIHDALGLVIGNAGDMREMAELLDKMSDNIASIYQGRAGGLTKSWRTRMQAETWYSAAEAVSAGLADTLGEPAKKAAATNQIDRSGTWDMSVFRYASRNHAPAPVLTEPVSESVSDPVSEPVVTEPVFVFDAEVFRNAIKEAAKK